ncbi:N-acetylmuramoyl-L-alanine amidase [Desulfonatronum sp. SC1]|uniref:N-acetylmuramoyl-L-alanine amidase n=1 Tax=Desulfonatronum sp. SC1 TaxID=2109626 RepID=UPI000D31D0D3|nr:N-acetylmuramoyl-L-alanine amidase [Desulfonatronum sp. SC1]PTN35988.1 N-acetylmuramoyl-L-alanine amidase [Desulfonatronum sp. SC1]
MPIRHLWLLLYILILSCGGPLAAVSHASAERDYTSGWNEFHRLLKEPGQAQNRNAWLATRNMFNSAFQKDSAGPEAPKALFYLGRVHEEMGLRFGQASDFSQAADYYGRVALRFANHTWADDALLRKAKIHLEHLNDSAQAYIDLLSIVHNHPKGDMAPQAQTMLRELDSAFLAKVNASGAGPGSAVAATLPASSSARTSEPAVQASLSGPVAPGSRSAGPGSDDARLTQVRYWSSDEYTRVVLDVDAEVAYSHRLLNPDPDLGTPHRLMIDLQGTVLGSEAPAQLHVADGILRQVRTGQNQPHVSRVVLDIQRLEDFRVFTLEGPFRIVIDVSGAKSKALADSRPSPPAGRSQVSSHPGDVAGSLIEQLGLTVSTIMIDPGHGGKDPGAVAHGIKEKDINLRMSRILGRMLEEKGFRVLYTRTTDVFIPLEERTAMANAQKADLFLSIHANAHPNPNMKGFEIYSLNLARNQDAVRVAARENAVSSKKISDLQLILTDLMLNSKITESRELATKIHGNTITGMRRTHPSLADRGVREAPFYVLMGAKMPAVLIEMGYLTNRDEARLLNTDAYLRTLATNLLQGVLAYRDHIERHAKL